MDTVEAAQEARMRAGRERFQLHWSEHHMSMHVGLFTLKLYAGNNMQLEYIRNLQQPSGGERESLWLQYWLEHAWTSSCVHACKGLHHCRTK